MQGICANLFLYHQKMEMTHPPLPKILVIDENPEFVRSFRLLAAEAMSVAAHQVSTARNLHEGMVLAHINTYDYVFMSIDPDHMGIITLARISFDNHPDHRTKLIVFSYLPAKEMAADAIGKGADNYLPKDEIDMKNLELLVI